MTVRTRFAPSPTGYLHVGGIRTALFAWLVARQAGGQFVLRLEDTDKAREVEGSAEHLIESLRTLGLNYDEGPDVGGPFAPYKQSERLETYRQWAQKLIDQGRAYADPYTSQEVQAFREQAQAEKRAFLYRNHRPENPAPWDGTTPLRFKSDPKDYTWHDEVMGDLRSGPEVIDDFILIKSDGYPTYNFAHIVDDAEMQITHVIRGQEFLSSMPNYLNLYEALGLQAPIFATMPHVLNETGNKKLGKRDGAKDVLDYIREGYLPETLVSFIATLGWNDGTEKEVFTVDELISKFSLSRIQRSGARFDEKRLLWVNGQVIRQLPIEQLTEKIAAFWPPEAASADDDYRRQVLEVVQERLKTLTDLPALSTFFFVDPAPNWSLVDSDRILGNIGRDAHIQLLRAAKVALENTEYNAGSLRFTLNQLLETTGEQPATLFSLIRYAITWAPFSPALPETMAVIGRDRVLARIQAAIDAARW